MNETDSKFYCRIDASMVDYCDEKEVREHSRELTSFCDLSERFSLLKRAYETANKEHTNIVGSGGIIGVSLRQKENFFAKG